MVVQAAFAAPVFWFGGSPVLAYNLVLLAGFVLTGWTMCLVVREWTRNWTAGLVSGILFAFNAHTLTRIPHLQAQHGEFLPLAVFALDRVLAQPTMRHALRLALWFSLQALTSVYLLVFTAAAMVAATLARGEAWWGSRFKRVVLMLAVAGAVAAGALLPFLLPYRRVSQDLGFTRSLVDATWYSASWRDYLATPSRIHFPLWSHQFFFETALFPGALGLALTAVALGRRVGFADPRARMCLAIGLAGFVLSFGPKFPPYALLYTAVPLLHGIRGTARFGYLVIFGVAALAGFGVMALQRVVPARRWPVIAGLLVVIAALEPLAAPLGLTRVSTVAPIYARLREEPEAVVVEVPFYNGRAAFAHAPYMLNSTAHWRPLINGYSGFQPASFHRHAEALAQFPDGESIPHLERSGVTHVFVHTNAFTPETLAGIATRRELEQVETFGTIALYRLKK
jgi:hypothetical protein